MVQNTYPTSMHLNVSLINSSSDRIYFYCADNGARLKYAQHSQMTIVSLDDKYILNQAEKKKFTSQNNTFHSRHYPPFEPKDEYDKWPTFTYVVTELICCLWDLSDSAQRLVNQVHIVALSIFTI